MDLANDRQVDFEEAKAFADDNNCLIIETSAKSNQNVTEVFKAIAQKLPKDIAPTRPQGVPLDSDIVGQDKSSGGCC